MRVFDTSFDFQTDESRKAKRDKSRGLGDPDANSVRLRADHELLWTKELCSGVRFSPSASSTRFNEYLIFTDSSGARHCYGSDAITNSYTRWLRPKALADAVAGLDEEQRARFLNPPYTIGSAMIWPVRSKDRPTINQARGTRTLIADRMDLTLESIRRHYAGPAESPLADVINAYADFFELFGQGEQGFRCFVDFFHFQDLVTPDYNEVLFFLPFDNFRRSGTPKTTGEYVEYRENVLDFIAKRGQRMAKWVIENRRDIEVRE